MHSWKLNSRSFKYKQITEGNEKADSLAKEAATDRKNESNIPIPHQDLLASTTKAEKEEWNRIWTTTNTTKIHDIARHFYQKIPNNNISRKKRIAMTRLWIGHSKITNEYLLSKTECNTCNQHNHHSTPECRKYRNLRSK